MDFTRLTEYLDSLPGIGVPGLDLIVCQDGARIYRHMAGTRDAARTEPVRGDETYRLYSCTKLFTTCALQFINGDLDINDDAVWDKYVSDIENMNIDGAKNILINVSSSGSVSLFETEEMANIIRASADPNSRVFWGNVEDPTMADDELSVTVIATGFNQPSTSSSVKELGAIESKKDSNDNLLDINEFDSLMSGSVSHHKSEAVCKEYGVFEPVSVQKDGEETEEAGSLGKDLAASYSSRPRGMSIEPPAGFSASDDLSQPACWRNRGLSREINLR